MVKAPRPPLSFSALAPTQVLHIGLMGPGVSGGAVPEPALPSAPVPAPVPARCPPPHPGGQLAAGRMPTVVRLGRERGGLSGPAGGQQT